MPRLIDHGLRDGKRPKKAKSKKPKRKDAKGSPKPKGPASPHTNYTEAMAKEICSRLAEGESLRSICRSPHIAAASTVIGWALQPSHPFCEQYARAREIGYRKMAEELLEIADDGTNDYLERAKEEGSKILVDHDHISRSRLRIDTRKWLLSKVLPKVYGDNFTLKGDKDNPLTVNLTVENILADVNSIGGRIPTHQGASERLALAN